MNSGIYCIRNKVNGKQYIGQTVDFDFRFRTHLRELKNNKHPNTHLQRSFNKHGESSFEFSVLERYDGSDMTEKEQKWIDSISRPYLYNIVTDVIGLRGKSNPFFGKNHTEESKRKMSNWKKENFVGKGNPNFGKKHSCDTRRKMSLGRSKKIDEEKVLAVVDLLKSGESHQDIADKLCVGRTTVTRISNGTRWANITGGPVFPVVHENGKRVFAESHKIRIGESRLGMKYNKRNHRKSNYTKELK